MINIANGYAIEENISHSSQPYKADIRDVYKYICFSRRAEFFSWSKMSNVRFAFFTSLLLQQIEFLLSAFFPPYPLGVKSIKKYVRSNRNVITNILTYITYYLLLKRDLLRERKVNVSFYNEKNLTLQPPFSEILMSALYIYFIFSLTYSRLKSIVSFFHNVSFYNEKNLTVAMHNVSFYNEKNLTLQFAFWGDDKS